MLEVAGEAVGAREVVAGRAAAAVCSPDGASFIEEHPVFLPVVEPMFKAIDVGGVRAVSSSIKTPDALQIAAALSRGCSALVTNDRKLPTIAGLKVLDLGSFPADP